MALFSVKGLRFAASTLLAVIILAGCRENAIIQSGLTPAVDNIHTFGIGPEFANGTDTLTILSTTIYNDSVVTSDRDASLPILHGAGVLNTDPFFGSTTAGIYMQVVPGTSSFSFKADDVIDSAVLVLPYSGFSFGDTTAAAPQQQYRVYPIVDTLSKDSTYYAFTTKAVNTGLLYGSATVQPSGLRDSVKVWGVKKAPHLRIPLTAPAIDALRFAANNDTTNADFLKLFPGIFIGTDTSMPGSTIPYFRLDGGADPYTRANVLVYYRNTGASGGTAKDSLTTSFGYDMTYAAHYNRITRNYTGTPAAPLVNGPENQYVLLQNAPGAAISVRVPFLKNLPGVLISKAELVITQISINTMADATYRPPVRIYPIGVNEDGSTYTIADRYPLSTSEGLDLIGGVRKDFTVGAVTVSRYVINIPREVQQILSSPTRSELHLRLVGTQTFPGAYRLIAGGRQHPDPMLRMHMNIVYSKQ